ncbi:hypothetical protein P8452_60728 [Trifolium repens]|nr:hypothetical protein QL285_038041 [Trifolium repens]WJX77414.1 hypothetical protein P8452_60728 [Trifolium repens]
MEATQKPLETSISAPKHTSAEKHPLRRQIRRHQKIHHLRNHRSKHHRNITSPPQHPLITSNHHHDPISTPTTTKLSLPQTPSEWRRPPNNHPHIVPTITTARAPKTKTNPP